MNNENKPIILGGEPKANTNTQQLDNPNMTGSILPEDFLSTLNPQYKEQIMEDALCNNREQLRKQIIENGRTSVKEQDTTMFKPPRKGCKRCHGTGRNGWHSSTGEVNICDCMRRGKLMDSNPDDFLSMGDFLEIFTVPKPAYPRNHIRPKSVRKEVSRKAKLARKSRKRNARNND